MYTGREYDRGLKLYYNRARYYDPKLARFISRDPIDIADDVNLYAYVGNNSMMFVDLMGTEKKFINAYDDYLYTQNIITGTTQQIELINQQLNGYKTIPTLTQSVLDNLISQRDNALEVIFEKEELAKKLHLNRNDFNINLPIDSIDAKNKNWIKLPYYKSIYHQNGVPLGEENEKWISQNGKREIVFNYETGLQDNSKENLGTYNFYSPDQPLLHKKYDIDPYKLWGN